MDRKVVFAIIWPFVFAFVFVKIITSDFVKDFAVDPCDVARLEEKYTKFLHKTPQNEDVQRLFNIAKKKLDSLEVPHEKQEEIFVTGMVHSRLIKNGCVISDEFGMRMIDQLYMGQGEGHKVCEDDLYLAEAEKTYENLYKNKLLGNTFEMVVLCQMVKNMGIPEGEEFIKKKWQDGEFRKSMMVSLYQATEREENDCKNPYLPLKKELLKILTSYSREQKKK